MNGQVDDILKAGVQIMAIGNGTALMAKDFAESFAISYPLYTDPGRSTYKWFGMKRSFGLGLSALKRGIRAYKGGFRQGATQGDPWQQGGMVLLDKDGDIRWLHVDEGPGAHAAPEEVRDIISKMTGQAL